jgi:hypothetical protein
MQTSPWEERSTKSASTFHQLWIAWEEKLRVQKDQSVFKKKLSLVRITHDESAKKAPRVFHTLISRNLQCQQFFSQSNEVNFISHTCPTTVTLNMDTDIMHNMFLKTRSRFIILPNILWQIHTMQDTSSTASGEVTRAAAATVTGRSILHPPTPAVM